MLRGVLLSLLVVLLLPVAPVPASVAGAGIVRLTVVHTNDIHGGIDPAEATYMNPDFPPKLGGGASMVTFLRTVREDVESRGGHFLLVDAGDIFQGTPVGTVTKGRAVIDFMNRARYDVLALGNHDFDEGKENAQELVRRANFPVIAANLLDEDTGEVVDWVDPWIVRDFGDLKVGIFGLITPETKDMSFPANIAGLEFATLAPVARRCVQELQEQGVDLILGVGHVGIPYDAEAALEDRLENGFRSEDDRRAMLVDVAHNVEGIDAFFGGHVHKGFDAPISMPDTHTLLFQTYGRGSGAGIVTMSVDTETNQLVGYDLWTERGYLVTFFEDQFWPDPETSATIGREVAEAESGMDRVIGRANGELTRGGDGETPMGNAVCDAMLEETDADFAFTNLGGIRDELGPGEITPRDVFQVLPFGNTMIVAEMSGALLRQVIEKRISADHHGLYVAGGRVVYNKTRPDFDRVVDLEVGGEPWHPDSTYRVVTSDFLMQGNVGLDMLPGIPDSRTTYTGKTMREALENWVKRHSPVTPRTDGRWVRDDTAGRSPDFERALQAEATP
jgi:2',3'-cyclic-nucleotide 2'-phosphodiesterase (5'-nucleotidase family)